MNLLKLLVKEIKEQYVQENFIRLNAYFRDARNLVGFEFLEITLSQVSQRDDGQIFIPHHLGYQPKDVLVTRATGPGILSFNYEDFTQSELSVSLVGGAPTKTNPIVVRCYVGTHIDGDL